jgi:diacylglycerol kinase family enzyme
MPKLFVIFNPTARGEKSQRLRAFLETKAGPDVTLAPTNCAGDAMRLAAEGQRTGHEIIVAAGGDGTVNEVVNGLTGGTLGVLPLGTANVFARELGIPLRLEQAWAVLERVSKVVGRDGSPSRPSRIQSTRSGEPAARPYPQPDQWNFQNTLLECGQTRVVDVGLAGERRFVQLAGVGFDAAAVRAASWRLKKKLGPLAYVVAGIQTLRGPLPAIEVAVNGEVRARGAAVLVGNGRFYGGSFRLFPQARLDDGLLDVCVFERVTLPSVVRHGWGVLRAAHVRQRGVHYFQAAHFECRANVPLELDGEDAGDASVKFSVVPGALRVVVP